MATITPGQFRSQHPDLTDWMPADYEAYEVLVENTGKTPRPVTRPDTDHNLKTTPVV